MHSANVVCSICQSGTYSCVNTHKQQLIPLLKQHLPSRLHAGVWTPFSSRFSPIPKFVDCARLFQSTLLRNLPQLAQGAVLAGVQIVASTQNASNILLSTGQAPSDLVKKWLRDRFPLWRVAHRLQSPARTAPCTRISVGTVGECRTKLAFYTTCTKNQLETFDFTQAVTFCSRDLVEWKE